MPTLGPVEFVIIFVIILVLFGAGWMAGTVESLGKGIRQFRAEARKEEPRRESSSTEQN